MSTEIIGVGIAASSGASLVALIAAAIGAVRRAEGATLLRTARLEPVRCSGFDSRER